jgi:hypothetical protein
MEAKSNANILNMRTNEISYDENRRFLILAVLWVYSSERLQTRIESKTERNDCALSLRTSAGSVFSETSAGPHSALCPDASESTTDGGAPARAE